MNNQKRFTMAITALAESFRQRISEGLFHGYRLGLEGLSIDEIETACKAALMRSTFLPTPAELRELALTGGRSYEQVAAEAFNVFLAAFRRHSHCNVAFADPLITATVRTLGGFSRVASMSRTDVGRWYRQEFIATYVAFCRSGIREDQARPLGAIVETEHSKPAGSIDVACPYSPPMPQALGIGTNRASVELLG